MFYICPPVGMNERQAIRIVCKGASSGWFDLQFLQLIKKNPPLFSRFVMLVSCFFQSSSMVVVVVLIAKYVVQVYRSSSPS
jgi:hypothetical protein